MRIGAALPSNVFRLEYSNYLKEEFGYGSLDFYQTGILFLDRTIDHSIDGSKLRALWEYENDVSETLSDGVYLVRPNEDVPHLFTKSDLYIGWWKIRLKINGTIGASNNQIHLIRADSSNYILLEIGVNNALLLRKRVSAAYTTLIDCGINLTSGQWFDVEVTRDALGNYQVWVNTVSKGTVQDAFLCNARELYFECYSSVGMYIKEVYIDYSKPT